jgi:threonine/homoserine/homoserine lactone efflux protein
VTSEALLTFILASTLLSLAPGPDNIFVLLQSALHGRKAGLLVTLGLCTGLLVHTSLVAAGVAAIFLVNAVAFSLLKFAGAFYLVFLAAQAWQAGSSNLGTAIQPPLSPWQLYRRGIFMNVTNPKVAIFFLAFLPQFATPNQNGIAIQIILLGFIFIVITALVFSLVAVLSARLALWFKHSPGVQQGMNRIAAMVFVALAVRLALTSQ